MPTARQKQSLINYLIDLSKWLLIACLFLVTAGTAPMQKAAVGAILAVALFALAQWLLRTQKE